MATLAFTVLMVGVWGLNLLNGTGLGTVYHTIELSQLAALMLSAAFVLQKVNRNRSFLIDKTYFYVYLGMGAVFILSSWWGGYGLRALDYLWAFLVVYIFSNIPVRKAGLRLAGLCYGVLGAAILFIYNYMSALDGWNPNDIAMVGLFSFLMFIIPYFGATDGRSKFMLTVAAAVYVFLLWPTDSRSCIIAIVVALPLIFRIIPTKGVLRSDFWLAVVLLVPLVVAIVVCILADTPLMDAMNEWSMEQTDKPIFNGREDLWLWGMELLEANVLFGTGELQMTSWHNSAIECLVSYGCVGFLLWTGAFWLPLKDAKRYTGDVCVSGAMIAFLVIFCQQSVELGFIGRNPNMLPYVMLGVLLGRIKYLKEKYH